MTDLSNSPLRYAEALRPLTSACGSANRLERIAREVIA